MTIKSDPEKLPYSSTYSSTAPYAEPDVAVPGQEPDVVLAPHEPEIIVNAVPVEQDITVTGQNSVPDPFQPVAPVVPYAAVSDDPTKFATTTTTASLVSGFGSPLIPSLKLSGTKVFVVKPNLFLSSTAGMDVVTDQETGQVVPLRVVSNYQNKLNQVLLLDEQRPIAVLRKNDPTNPDKFHLFCVAPMVPNQSPSISMKLDNGQPMYVWGTVVNANALQPYNSSSQFNFNLQNGWQITAKRKGAGLFKKRNPLEPQKFDIIVHTRHVQVAQRNVNVSHGLDDSLMVSIHQLANLDWNVTVRERQNNLDPILFIILALLLDEVGRTKV